MKNQFSTGFFGYKREQVDRYIQELKKDYEEELGKKKDRMTELNEENRRLKQELEEQNERIERFIEQEKYISRALVKAEQRAQAIIEDSQHRVDEEMYLLKMEKEKWRAKFKEIRTELLDFEQSVLTVMERFKDEINYYAAKEISETLLLEENENQHKIKKVTA